MPELFTIPAITICVLSECVQFLFANVGQQSLSICLRNPTSLSKAEYFFSLALIYSVYWYPCQQWRKRSQFIYHSLSFLAEAYEKKRNRQALQRAIYWSRLNNSRFAKFSNYSWPVFCQRRKFSVHNKMKSLILALTTIVAIYSVNCDVYFDEKFPDGKFY